MADQSISIRLALTDGGKVKAELVDIGASGQKALERSLRSVVNLFRDAREGGGTGGATGSWGDDTLPTPSNGEVVLLFVAPRAFRIPANASGSQLKAGTAATGSSVFSIKKNGTEFLTATVAAAGTTASFSSSQTDFAAGDVLKVTAPSTADATLADIAITLAANLDATLTTKLATARNRLTQARQ